MPEPPATLADRMFAKVADWSPYFSESWTRMHKEDSNPRPGLLNEDNLYHVYPGYMLQLRLNGEGYSPKLADSPVLAALTEDLLLLVADKLEHCGREALALVEKGEARLVSQFPKKEKGTVYRVPEGYVIVTPEQAKQIQESSYYADLGDLADQAVGKVAEAHGITGYGWSGFAVPIEEH